jgi:type I restriction enzyme S subunit
MIANLKPYPAMRESGVPWLGAVPATWERRRLKSLLRPIDRRSTTGAETLLSLRRDHGIVVYSEHFSRPAQGATTVGYKIVIKGQLVINRLQANNGLVFDSSLDGLVSPDYSVFECQESDRIVMPYLSLLLRTSIYRDHFRRESTGLGTGSAGFLRLYDDRFLETPVVVPPTGEQVSILRFLDYAERRIRRYIRGKQKLIKLLEEQRQAITHRAVTRGLDSKVIFKPTGIDWLGDVPRHWEVRRLRYLIEGKLAYGANAAAEHVDPHWPRYLRITDFRIDGTLRSDTFRSLPPDVAQDYLVKPGDVLLARSGATVGKAFLVTAEAGEACHAGYLIRARPRRGLILPEFLFAFTQSAGFNRWKDSTFIIATIQNIGADKYADLVVPLPPLLEQKAIIRFLEGATNNIVEAIGRAQREISLLREYGVRLMADVVTGKVDVGNAAARLPDEVADVERVEEFEFEPESEGSDGQSEALAEETEA